jgi:ubiquinone biosynthesis protein UbiJ
VQNQHDPAVITAALMAAEGAINRGLELDPASARDLADLSGTILAIECWAPALEVFAVVEPEGRLHLTSYCEQPCSVRVRGGLSDFLALTTADDPAVTLINSDLEIIGNSAPLIALQTLVGNMQPDWEAPLVEVLGDVAGHQLANLLRQVFSWGQNSSKSLRRQLSEFILEEGRLSPPAAELENFYQEIDSLVLKTDRIESRLKRLAQRLESQIR